MKNAAKSDNINSFGSPEGGILLWHKPILKKKQKKEKAVKKEQINQ